ncbi:hypothetical protein BCIN_13g03180 [Botrytis cinerea B05.10]|uniref:Heterokaryon incompatibility domain-containing protein n=1 Tax=Botryotinia fuckeliana (strain B05.10) TaxID=332648 RepID=A0A384K0X1_BOTFB|nr:hypothetical protein BCIN_13g03180 [Botrytis cinerea B05.10]ATZ56480.1 hypothetical protein BCIN_13g03180 [Botrytis cinerea B05.10]
MDSRREEYSRNDEITGNLENGLLCETCAQSLELDDARAGGVRTISPKNGKAVFSFPTRDYVNCVENGTQSEPRLVTLPLLPELSDECRFCCKVKAEFDKAYGPFDSWQSPMQQASFQVQYKWARKEDFFDHDGDTYDSLNKLELTLHHPSHKDKIVQFYVAASSLDPCREWLGITKIPLEEKSEFTERKAIVVQDWVNKCALNSECSRISEFFHSFFVPSRLLDIGSRDSNDNFIKLIDTETSDLLYDAPFLRYICLSYCWGKDGKLLRTTTENMKQYKERISIDSSMPLVFRDAISVTRKLGIRYLWIDALCIIQDGDHGQDWAEQSTMMGDVFAHAWMTIAAAVPSSCHESLFHPRYNNSIEVGFKSSINPKISGDLTIILTPCGSSLLNNDMQNSRWNSRGWVWQEQRLSQRLLVFGKYMLRLRCHSRDFTEDDEHHMYWLPTESAFFTDDLKHWSVIALEYSKRQLTNPGDRLAAISGFVKLLTKRNKHTGKQVKYLAGIWLSPDIPLGRQLLTIESAPSLSYYELLEKHANPQRYLAPSWSWVSFNASNYLRPRISDKISFKLADYNIEPLSRTSDATVAIKPGSSISLSGRLRNHPWTSVERDYAPKLELSEINGHKRCSITYFNRVADDQNERAPGARLNSSTRYFIDWIASSEDFGGRIIDSKLKIFLLYEDNKNSECSAQGLLLFPVEGNGSESLVYRRVGCFITYGPWNSSDWGKYFEVTII